MADNHHATLDIGQGHAVALRDGSRPCDIKWGMLPLDKATLARQRNVWIVLVCVNVGAPVSAVWEYHTGNANSTTALLSAALVLVAFNALILWTLSARFGREGWPFPKKRLILAAGTMAVTAFLITAFGVSQVKQRNNYFDLAMSDTPLSSIKPERKRLVVELIRRSATNSQEENKAMAEARKVPLNPAAYSPESFASAQVMQSTLAHLSAYAQIDFEYFGKQQSAREDFRRKMAACDPEYLKSWDADRTDYEDMENSANRLEHEWIGSVNRLYTYGEQHAREIHIKQGMVSISNPTDREEFGGLFGQSKALHEKLESLVQEEVKHQQQAKARIGG